MKLEKFYSVSQVKEQVFPSRSTRWIKDTFRSGEFGQVLRDDSGWQVSESALLEYQRRHAVGAHPVRTDQAANLVQFQKSSRL